MNTAEIVVVVVVAVFLLFALGGLAGARARARHEEPDFAEHVREADEALEHARAADKGWHRESMEQAARVAIGELRPGWTFEAIQLVLVDDRPGTEEDRAHFVASGSDGQARVILSREGDRWVPDSVE